MTTSNPVNSISNYSVFSISRFLNINYFFIEVILAYGICFTGTILYFDLCIHYRELLSKYSF